MEFKYRDDYNSSWIDQMIGVYNKTELKRSDPEKVDRAFRSSFAVGVPGKKIDLSELDE